MKFFSVCLIVCAIFSAIASAYDEPPTREEVEKWRINAESGDAESQFNLAEAYRKGDIVPQSEEEAARWYERSANQGYPEAIFDMGFVYRGGNGAPMDKIMSYMWFYLASRNGDARATGLMNDLAWSMNEEEIKEGRKKALLWKAEKEEQGGKRRKRQAD